jgi:hypothetical protein
VAFDRARAVTFRRTRRLALSTSILYFTAVCGLILTVILDPDGGVTGSASWLATLPWSILLTWVRSGTFGSVAALLSFAGLNAAFLYIGIGKLLRHSQLWKALVLLAVLETCATCAIWFLNAQEHDSNVRIVNGGKDLGVWIAIDQGGFEAMRWNNRTEGDIAPTLERHLVFIPNNTRGIYKRRAYLLKDGQLVDPSEVTPKEMAAGTSVEIEKIKIIEGPSKGLEGWIPEHRIQRLLTLFSL